MVVRHSRPVFRVVPMDATGSTNLLEHAAAVEGRVPVGPPLRAVRGLQTTAMPVADHRRTEPVPLGADVLGRDYWDVPGMRPANEPSTHRRNRPTHPRAATRSNETGAS